MDDNTCNRAPGAVAKPAQAAIGDSPAAASSCGSSDALASHQATARVTQGGDTDVQAVDLVLSNCLADGQIPDCSNVLQDKVRSGNVLRTAQ